MANLNGFDATTVEPVPTDFEPIPAGKYPAILCDSQEKQSKAGHSYLSLEFEIVEGRYKGRKLWTNLNLNHPDPKAVKFARAELASICKAVGVLRPTDSAQLHNLPVLLNVKVSRRKDNDELQNRIKGYEPKAAASGQPQQAPAGSNTAPWRR